MEDQSAVLEEGHLPRLSDSARQALGNAEGIRSAARRDEMQLEHLLLGLYDRLGGPIHRAFESLGFDRPGLVSLLEETTGGTIPPGYLPRTLEKLPPLSRETSLALETAYREAGEADGVVDVGQLFWGVLSVHDSEIVRALLDRAPHLGDRALEVEVPASLGPGSRGDEVLRLQEELSSLGLFRGATDGVYGEEMQALVRALQERLGTASDGIVGPETRYLLERGLRDTTSNLRPWDVEPHVAQILSHAKRERGTPIGASAVFDAAARSGQPSNAFREFAEILEGMGASPERDSRMYATPSGWQISEGLLASLEIARGAVTDRPYLWGRDVVTAVLFGPEPLEPEVTADLAEDWLTELRDRWMGFLAEDDPVGVDIWRAATDRMQSLSEKPATTSEPVKTADSPSTPDPPDSLWPTGTLGMGIAAVDADRPSPVDTDHLGVEDEAFAFARVVASHGTQPPLSIGVFGEWGSGKTFFLEKMRAHVQELQEGVAGLPRERRAYHTDIVQIQFNAWHYMEHNLWASLVDHIFRELDDWLRQEEKDEEQVEALFRRLATSRMLQLDALESLMEARRRRGEAEQEVQRKRSELQEARVKRDTTTLQDYWAAVSATLGPSLSEEDKARYEAAARFLGFDELSESAKGLIDALNEVRTEEHRGRLALGSLAARLEQPLWVAGIAIPLVAVPFLTPYLGAGVDWALGTDLAGRVSQSAAAVSSAMAATATWVGAAAGLGRGAVKRLASFQDSLDRAIQEKKQKNEPVPEELRMDQILEKREREVKLAEEALASIAREVEEVRGEFSQTAAMRLNRFIRDKIVDGDYARHLGIIATIRKDFEQLAEIMSDVSREEAALGEHLHDSALYRRTLERMREREDFALLTPEEQGLVEELVKGMDEEDEELRFFQRIVLYIDDLDRCPPKTVVEVLQACHLLLSFPLFVVVVAVDARWVSGALLDQYAGLLEDGPDGLPRPDVGSPSAPGGQTSRGAAGPRDYLEKIFQIPYWVRHMDARASSSFTRDLVGPVLEGTARAESSKEPDLDAPVPPTGSSDIRRDSEARSGEASPAVDPPMAEDGRRTVPDGATLPGDAPSEAEADATTKSPPDRPASGERGVIQPGGSSGVASSPDSSPSRTIDPNPSSLAVTLEERAFLEEMAPFAGDSPRSIKRFVNVYRLLRTALREVALDTLVGDGTSRTYRAIIAQLAVVTGAPAYADHYFTALGPPERTTPATPGQLAERLEKELSDSAGEEGRRLLGALGALVSSDDTEEMMREMRLRAGVVKRYSFSARPYL